MKTVTKNVLIIAMMLFSGIASQQLKAQVGNVISVTPDSAQVGDTVHLVISGHNTHFIQATTTLRSCISGMQMLASSVTIINDSVMHATYIIPNSPFYVGLWDMYAANAKPLEDAFLVTSPNVVIQGSIFNDVNGNCVFDPTEHAYTSVSGSVLVQPGNIYVTLNGYGFYAVSLPIGTYTATVYFGSYWSPFYGINTCPTTDTVHVATSTSKLITHQDMGVGFNVVEGNVYHDSNGNCILDANEKAVSSGYVTLSYGPQTTTVRADGSYSFHLPLGMFSGTLTYTNPTTSYYNWSHVTCPSSNSIPVNITTNYGTLLANNNFGLTVTDSCPKLKTTISTSSMKPCSYHHSDVYVKNITPYTASNVVVVVNLDIDETPLAVSPIGWTVTPWTSIAGHTITYNIGSLLGFASKSILVWDSTHCGTPLGDTVCIEAYTSYTPSACMDSVFNYEKICKATSLTPDKNNKETTSPYGEFITANTEMNYTINFQNPDKDTVVSVTVVDTLHSELDPTTLIPGGSSAPYTFSMSGTNIATFAFHNINLPDSAANEPRSHGFVNFSIRQFPGHITGAIIQNRATIYFECDDNFVTTNYTYNMIPTFADIETQNIIQGISVYPNPFTNTTHFVFNNKKADSKYTLTIYDVTGKKVKEITNITENYYDLNRENLNPQVYFYKVNDNQNQIGVGKLIIMN